MRLLHIETLELKEFFGEEVPPYAILSHRWDKSEVSFTEMREKRNMEGHPGMAKIQGFCNFARTWMPRERMIAADGSWSTKLLEPVEWGWLDTCCIDKSSSAELSEAINSMFSWYKDSTYCCVYLADVPPIRQRGQVFGESEWFRRGWTLQELLAPSSVLFCNSIWQLMGHKCEHVHLLCQDYGEGPSLNEHITVATKISLCYLDGSKKYNKASIACRMSWASTRKTTRVEDIAYCMLGIFDAHLTPMYGEGTNAFRRLQEEIIRRSNDQSIFAWFNLTRHLSSWEKKHFDTFVTPILAVHPADFLFSGDVETSGQAPEFPYTTTNIGLEIRAKVRQYELQTSGVTIMTLELNCKGGLPLPRGLHGKNSESRTTRIAIVNHGVRQNNLVRMHILSTSDDALGPVIAQGKSKRLLYIRTEGPTRVFMMSGDLAPGRLRHPGHELRSQT